MAELTHKSIAATGTTRFRPPYTPVAIGALAGAHRGRAFKPARLTAAHGWAESLGAVFIETGLWLRAAYFRQSGDKDWRDACNREVKAVREHVGLCDVSTLGKIEVAGRDVAAFLDRLYCNPIASLAVGRARYGLMLREDGFVMDDGTVARLEPERFVISTTTANAVRVMAHMEFCAEVLWPDLDVQMASVTEQWAQFALAGPAARAVLGAVVAEDFDVSNAAFPFMGVAATALRDGTPARLFRISFSGELAYEIAVPARTGEALARALMEAGRAYGILPYGLEALNVLRIEKGHAAGGELNGQTTAADLGLGRMMSTKKDYIGAVLAGRPALIDHERPSLVGLRPVNPNEPIGAGAHLLRPGAENKARNDEGHVTSAAFSPTCGWIALGLLRRGPQRLGERVRAYDPIRGRDTLVQICTPVFHDPDGMRLRG
jgi:sarcosine oxidase subunit alpha